MASLYQEIANAARLLQSDKHARNNCSIEGIISPKAKKDIKAFNAQALRAFQTLNNVTNLYIKSFFYDTRKEILILYTRIKGEERKITVSPVNYKKFTFNTEGALSYTIRRLLTGILSYYIPSENSTYNHKALNLMPYWRHNQ